MFGVRRAIKDVQQPAPGVRLATALTTLVWITRAIGAEPPDLEWSFVPASDIQPGGPTYDFRVSRFEIRNDQFVAFLNDVLDNLASERARYVFFDSSTGDVYVNGSPSGQSLPGAGGRTTLMFSPGIGGHIAFVDGSYRVLTFPWDYSAHPVTGVTWYGAVKYCNWLTLVSGLPLGQQAYTEGPDSDPTAWRPATIAGTDWAARDLTSSEREELLGLLGYRLPMDGGQDAAGPYNEWYKAAAWDSGAGWNRAFGFGRDVITGQDANFLCSGDPFEGTECMDDGGTTPVGYYDGTDHQGAFQTNPLGTENAFGLFDMSGNVWEWVQDQSPSSPGRRRERGGSWRNFDTLVQAIFSADRSASSTDDATGFRVVQSIVHDVIVTPFDQIAASGPWGGPYDVPFSDRMTYRVASVVPGPVSFTAATDSAWTAVTPAEGYLLMGESVDLAFSIEPDCGQDGLVVGDNTATLSIRDGTGLVVAQRGALLTVREPLQLAPAEDFNASMSFAGDPSPFNKVYTFTSASDTYVRWSASWHDTSSPSTGVAWLTIDGGVSAAGQVPPHSSWPVVVAIDATTAGTLDLGSYAAQIVFVDECTGTRFTRDVGVTVLAPFSVSPAGTVASSGVAGGPFDPPDHTFTVRNELATTIDWTVALCTEAPGSATCTPPTAPAWLSLDTSGGSISPYGTADVTASLTASAADLEAGGVQLTVRFSDPAGGFAVERVVRLDVTGLHVTPPDDARFNGPSGGPFTPASFVYTLQNVGIPQMSWEASVVFSPPLDLGAPSWLDVVPMRGVILDANDIDEAVVSLTSAAALLPEGTYEAAITFRANGQSATDSTRSVHLAVGAPSFSIPMAMVPAEELQPDGPTHAYRIGINEVTNAQFVQFLNAARRNAAGNAPDERSEFMYFDTDSGDVYINTERTGAQGTDAPTDVLTTKLFDAAVSDGISYLGGEYTVSQGRGDYPVAGVTWYGAVKFCNWMTLTQGMDAAERAYLEGPAAAEWIPALARPNDLVTVRGFRLPMDGGASAAAPFNEWHKAASRRPDNAQGDAGFGAVYGFGGDTLTPADANYLESNDPFEPGPSPVGYFGTDNGYGLNDMTGNVAEWMHDIGDSALERATRGGHFNSVGTSLFLRTDGRGSVPADSAFEFVGFRVAQSIEHVALELTPLPVRIEGYVGGPYSPSAPALQIHNPGRRTIDDITIEVSPPWLQPAGGDSVVLPGGSTIEVLLTPSDSAVSAGISPTPPGDFALVSGMEVQAGGPLHDFWANRTEVMNSQFAVFLNDARSNALGGTSDARSEYMYFDSLSGSVYVNTDQTGREGVGPPSGPSPTLLYDAGIGRIQLVGGRYSVEDGYETDPVVGVTWFGAVKYCNWLTIFEGLPPSMRAYREAPSSDLDGWHPVTVDTLTWTSGGMTDAARASLVADTLGYRLPMDDAATTASTFNEWYKLASRKGVDEQGIALFGARYGFGGDAAAPLPTEANYLGSGDTQEDGTTPARFFDGINVLAAVPDQVPTATCVVPNVEPVKTVNTANGYGVYDACGNVREWTQDFGSDISNRATRGGSWRDEADWTSLTTAERVFMLPQTAADDTGFRIVRGTGHLLTATVRDQTARIDYVQRFILDLREPFTVSPLTAVTDPRTSGGYGDGFAGIRETYTLSNHSASSMDWAVSVDRDWVAVTGPVPGELAGTIPGSDGTTTSELTFNVTTTDLADGLGPGTHKATVAFSNLTSGQSQTRDIVLTIAQPVTVTPEQSSSDQIVFQGPWQGPFAGPLLTPTFQLTSLALDLDYTVSVDVPWVTLQSDEPLSGTLTPARPVAVTPTINGAADLLDIGQHRASIRFDWIDRGNGGVAGAIEREILLNVDDPISISPPDEVPLWSLGPELNPGQLPAQSYLLTHDSEQPIEVLVTADVVWLSLDQPAVEVLPGQGRTVVASANEEALALTDGVYQAHVTFEDTLTGIRQCRLIQLTINQTISVVPYTGLTAVGVRGGPITPLTKTYTLINAVRDGAGPIEWEASTLGGAVDWLSINGGASAAGNLNADGDAIGVRVVINAERTNDLAEGLHQVVVEFRDLTNGETITRTVSLTLTDSRFSVAESLIPAADDQPGGPAYSYNMARYLTTNAQFVEFLNNAMGNPDNERGQYMFFDTTTGDVYIHDAVTGASGTSPGAHVTKLFSPAVAHQVEFVNGAYRVVTTPIDYSLHPVTGVTWYGAIKYCNWLTIDQGMSVGSRCYTEDVDSSLTGWHPVTISTALWAARDMNDAERLSLITDYRGYRLPMDEGYDNVVVDADQADGYNEWYKAASRAGTDAQGNAVFNALYGFGRSTLTPGDANFLCSGDPFEDQSDCTVGATTPTGFYDGVNVLRDGTLTNAGDNAYGLFDLTGNVYEWIQGRFNRDPGSISYRTLRGGRWHDPPEAQNLMVTSRTLTAPERSLEYVGFRVVRTLPAPTGDGNQDGVIDQTDFTDMFMLWSGPGVNISSDGAAFDFQNDGDVDLADFAPFQTVFASTP